MHIRNVIHRRRCLRRGGEYESTKDALIAALTAWFEALVAMAAEREAKLGLPKILPLITSQILGAEFGDPSQAVSVIAERQSAGERVRAIL